MVLILPHSQFTMDTTGLFNCEPYYVILKDAVIDVTIANIMTFACSIMTRVSSSLLLCSSSYHQFFLSFSVIQQFSLLLIGNLNKFNSVLDTNQLADTLLNLKTIKWYCESLAQFSSRSQNHFLFSDQREKETLF